MFQKEIAEAVSIPVFVSSLLQVPLAHQMTRAPVGVLTASAPSLTEKHIAGAGCEGIPIAVQGLEETEEFAAVILRNERVGMDLGKVEQEVLAAGRALIEKAPNIGAVVLECTDLPPYAHQLQAALDRPVFDLTTHAKLMHDVVSRQVYSGIV
ncbi:aspartate/glutamate racemase family protein [Alisedimentitalea sp. MJ-SS2]|uniref:aspartate/glutamate racemase family protein n=1 Tax=Aliisedimentitalea sp. MJ-SS2 TaxID=3049795 RepID=UPI00290EE710|nr:aspartate/glutamate racemase family protein [Alisedimentitalea sp. MJ-SS2]MDU8929227.1 aspartate/glutamate racemase family protein [Alisedimentitalea sp. MJ-SS2]